MAAPEAAFNAPEEIYPGYPGMVVRDGADGRILETMNWGWPLRLKTMKPDAKPKAVNNIADIRKPMWIGAARKPQNRCLVPATHFAEAQGPKGKMTRTWMNDRSQPIFAWAGLWRNSDEWGPVYSCAMTDANEDMRPVHNRMPVILQRDEWDVWMKGSLDELVALQQRSYPAGLIAIDRTTELWRRN